MWNCFVNWRALFNYHLRALLSSLSSLPPQWAAAPSHLPPKCRGLTPAGRSARPPVCADALAQQPGGRGDLRTKEVPGPPRPLLGSAPALFPQPRLHLALELWPEWQETWLRATILPYDSRLFLHFFGYSFKINRDSRPRLLSQATWVQIQVPPVTWEVTLG